MSKRTFSLILNPAAPRFGDDPAPLTMTQERLDQIIQERLERDRKARDSENAKKNDEYKKALSDLQELQTTLKMTDDEKRSMEEKVSELEKKVLTTDEIAAKEAKKAKEKYEADLQQAQQQAKAYADRYTSSRIDTELTTAAVAGGLVKTSIPIVLSHIKSNTHIVPVLDEDGKPTGHDKVVVAYAETKDGKTEVVELAPSEVFERMSKDTDTYGNLFDNKARGGLGGTSGAGTKKNGYRPGMSTAEYMKLRKENPELIYD